MANKHSYYYTARQGVEYSKVIKDSIDSVSSKALKRYVLTTYITNLISAIRAANLLDQMMFSRDAKKFYTNQETIQRAASQATKEAIKSRFNKDISKAWSDIFDLGTTHHVEDLLYEIPDIQKHLKEKKKYRARFSGFDVSSFPVAEFEGSQDEEDAEDLKTISRAKRKYVTLRRNIFELKQAGILYDFFDLEESEEKAARYSVEERKRYLQTILEAGNTGRKAEAAKKEFLKKAYLDSRLAVLTDDYAKTYDDNIKNLIADHLEKNVESVKQITDESQKIQTLANNIADQVQNSEATEGIKPEAKAAKILRTELNLAYNFGKIAAYSSEEDRNRRFQWNADWELANMVPGYEVCSFCKDMDGSIYTAEQIIRNGIRTDRSLLNYKGKNRTNFKDYANPVIPSHPNCSCFYTVLPKTKKELLQSASIAKDNKETVKAVAATALIVGGFFLLARSNVFSNFFATASSVSNDPVEDVKRAYETAKKSGAAEAFTDVFSDIITKGVGEL